MIKKNIIANFAGKAWSGLIQLLFLPLYIKFLGMEAFGLIGFFLMLQGLLVALDFGLSVTLNRELACRTADGKAQEAQNMVRSMEWIYWPIALIIAVGIILAAPWIAGTWVHPKGLSTQSVHNAIVLMGLVIAVQWPFTLYSGGLMGLQKQVLLNVIRSVMVTFQMGGAVLVLWFVSSSIEAYFIWQMGVVAVQTAITCYFLRISLPKSDKPASFQWDLLAQCWHFTMGMAGILTLTIILAQTDKIILSKVLSLEQFGYYMLVFTMGNSLMLMAMPISIALFPKLSALITAGNIEEMGRIYHKGCQTVSLFTLPAGVLMVVFPQEILMLWMRNANIAEHAHLLLSLVAAGCLLNAAITLPRTLQLAYGWTSLMLCVMLTALVVLTFLLFLLIPVFGAVGGALAWLLVNVGYVVFEIWCMHRRIISREMWRWYIVDFGFPVVACVGIGLIVKMIFPHNMTTFTRLTALGTAFGSMTLACVFVLPAYREIKLLCFRKIYENPFN